LELYDLVFGLMVLGVGSGVFMYAITRINPMKKAQKGGYDGIKSNYEVYNQQVKDIITLKDNQIKRLNAKITQLEPDLEQNESNTPIELGALEKLAQERGINPALLKNPMLQKLIKKYTKGMGIEEIIAIADQFGLLKGNKKSQPSDTLINQDQPQFF